MDEAGETVYPFILCSGARLPNAIHSRLHKVPWVRSLRPDPMADISTEDAQALGLKEGDDIELFTERGTISVKEHPTHRVQKNGYYQVYFLWSLFRCLHGPERFPGKRGTETFQECI